MRSKIFKDSMKAYYLDRHRRHRIHRHPFLNIFENYWIKTVEIIKCQYL